MYIEAPEEGPRFRDGLQAESDSDSGLNLMPNSDALKLGVPGFGMDDAFLHFTGEPKHP